MVLHWLPRLQHIEIHEEAWCPPLLRAFVQDYLRWCWETIGLVPPVVPILAKAVKATGATHIVDLCSGGGGPHRLLLPQLQAATGNRNVGMTLTDLWPHVEAWKELTAGVPGLAYAPKSVEATAVPPNLKGFRTLFGCLHHFPVELVRGMLTDAVAKGEGVGVFEGTSRDTPSILLMAVLAPLTAWLFPLLSRPLRLDYLFLGTLLPVGALLNTHDALVSCLRTYSPAEMRAIVEGVPGHEAYEWEFGMRPATGSGPLSVMAKVPYLIGIPKQAGSKMDGSTTD